MPHAGPVVVHAHAKINLALSVGPAIAAGPSRGFHPIFSWFVPIDLHDTLEIQPVGPGRPSAFSLRWGEDAPRSTPIDWPIEKDLAFRAHALMQVEVGRELPISAMLTKRIPAGGGLGGGSSDAAAMIAGLSRVFSLGLSRESLRDIGSRLGSDVPFFIDESDVPRSALVGGLGERIERLDRSTRSEVLLLLPPFGCPTGAVYRAFDAAPSPGLREARIRSLVLAPSMNSADLFNDLASPACAAEPRLRQTLEALRAALGPAHPVHVTGSGSTMFILPGARPLEQLADEARLAVPGVVAVPARLI